MAHHRIEYFRCGQTKEQAFPNRGRCAADFAFIQLNPADWLNFLVVDVDREDALMCLMHPAVPQPTWIIENEATGHAQAGWAIEPVYRGEGARPHPIRYAAAVQRSLDRLVDGDPCFTRHLVRNPAADRPAGRVWWGERQAPWSLGGLKTHMAEWVDPLHDETLDGPAGTGWDPGSEFTLTGGIPRVPLSDMATEVGRNTAVFRAVRRWLWDQWESRGHAPTNTASIAHAQALNAQLPDPLPAAELACLARSAVRQVNAGKGRPTRASRSDAAHEYLSQMGRRGGRARTEAKVTAAKDNAATARQSRRTKMEQLRAQAAQLRAAGATYQAIATAVGRTTRTVMNWLKGTADTVMATTVAEGETLQATGSAPGSRCSGCPSAAPSCPVDTLAPAPSSSTAPTPTQETPMRPCTTLTLRSPHWPLAAPHTHDLPSLTTLLGGTRPNFTDPALTNDLRGVLSWLPLDLLSTCEPGEGEWEFFPLQQYLQGHPLGHPLGGPTTPLSHMLEELARHLDSHGLRVEAAYEEIGASMNGTLWHQVPIYLIHPRSR